MSPTTAVIHGNKVMPLTLLIDLDDTFFINPAQSFFQEHTRLLAEHIQPIAKTGSVLTNLQQAYHVMLQKEQLCGTLQDVFVSTFSPGLGLPVEQLLDQVRTYYTDVFPSLKKISSPQPATLSLIERSLHHGWNIVITADPLYPQTAILQRLVWAGLNPNKVPLSLITSSENVHFSKRNPGFYLETMAQIGWPETPVVVISRDTSIPSSLGFSTIQLVDESASQSSPDQHSAGSLDQIFPMLIHIASSQPAFSLNSPAALLQALKITPAALESLTRPLLSAARKFRPQSNAWSITEIICHLHDVDRDINLPRLQQILSGTNPFLPGIQSDDWATQRNYQSQNDAAAFNHFCDARSQLTAQLDQLTPAELQLPARHAIFGPTNLQELVGFMVQHDRTHIQQIISNISAANQ